VVVAVGVGEGVSVGVAAILITTPLLQTKFLPDLIQVNFLPW
jgi:hypothetical protein